MLPLTHGCITAIPLFLCCEFLAAQSPGSPEFEAAVVRRFAPGPGGFSVRTEGGPGTTDPTRLTLENLTLKRLLMMAYDLGESAIEGPSWLDGERYQIQATIKPDATIPEVNEMLKNLLIERFNIAAHFQTKTGSHYELVATKRGSKLRPALDRTDAGADAGTLAYQPGLMLPRDRDGFLTFPPGFSVPRGFPFQFGDSAGLSHAVWVRATMTDLCNFLETQLRIPVLDKTGLTGMYDYNLEYGLGALAPDLVTAIQEQLGLKLDAKKGPYEVLVIDHVDVIPGEN